MVGKEFALLPTKTRKQGNPFKAVDWADRMSRMTAAGGVGIFRAEERIREGETVGGMQILRVTDGFLSFAKEHAEYHVCSASMIVRRVRRRIRVQEILDSLDAPESTLTHLWGILEKLTAELAQGHPVIAYATPSKTVLERIDRKPSWEIRIMYVTIEHKKGLLFHAEPITHTSRQVIGALIISPR